MKRILLLIAAAVLLQACFNEDGLAVKLPASMQRQWLGEDCFPDGTVFQYQVWDFLSNKDKLSIVRYKSLEDARTIPSYNLPRNFIFSYDCRLKNGIYTLTINDSKSTRVYLSDIKSNSMILTFDDGFSMNMTPLPFKLTAIPLDY